jgi:hemerythrin-like domain-containing protein
MAGNQYASRRRFLLAGTAVGTGLVSGTAIEIVQADDHAKTGAATASEDISPAEDLMREHGVLNRILLIYEEYQRRLREKTATEPAPLSQAATMVRTFVEDYHERLEEDHLFPRFEKAGKLVELVQTLRKQHRMGRCLTGQILQLATPSAIQEAESARTLDTVLGKFIGMYRPHEAREDTVLFPAIRSLMTAGQYDDLGELFEEREHQLFGKEGFEGIVERVADIEKTLGIYELAQWTPKA